MKRFLPLFALLCLFGALMAQPPNDDCNTATTIGPSNLDDGNGGCNPLTGQVYTDATPWEVSPGLFFSGNCWGGAVDSVVFYQFTAQGVSGSVEVTNGPSTAHIAVIDFNTNCDISGAVEVGCAVGAQIVWDNDLTVGTTYYVVVGFENSPPGTFDICVFNPPQAPNDECMNAIVLNNIDGSPCNTSLTNYYPSSENTIPACFPSGETESVWYSFVAQGVSIADLHVEGSAENAHIAIWDFSGGSSCNLSTGVLLECQANVTTTNPIVMDNELEIGNTYYVEVVFANDYAGNFSLCLDNPEPAFNDDCMNAEPYPANLLNDSTVCHTSVNGNGLNNDYPSSDIGVTYGCWNPGDSYNVWFSFVAQGPDLDVTVDALSFADAEQIAVIEFTGAACDPANWLIVQCQNGAEIDINNALELGHTYYVAVGFGNNGVGDYCINIFNPMPPENDTMCAAIMIPLNGTSTVCAQPQPTTTYANPEFSANGFPQSCQGVVQNTVWYTMQMTDPNNVGFSIDVNPTSLMGDVSVVLFEEPDCNLPGTFSIAFFYCGPAPADPLEWGPINENATYYLMIGSSEQGQGDFQLCVSEIPPCFNNNFCEDPNGVSSAVDLGTPETQSLGDCTGGGGPGFICYDGCNLFADPEPGLTGCLGQTDPVVWFSFTTDGTANILNMQITSEDMQAPSVQMFIADDPGDPCGSLIQVGLTQNNFGCMVGSNGQVVANSTPVGASSTYYIAVGGVNTFGGEFEICISTLEASAACVTDAEIVIQSRSFGGPLEGPFFPGEVLEICMNVNNFQVSTGVQNCQWFQGLVPVFGNGWDPGSFDGEGQPLNATLNGNNFPAPNVENGGTWDWWPQIMYHHPHCFYNVGDFDGNGTVDMCNALYDPDCLGPGLAGGCCGPCWNSTGPDDPGSGSPLPPGWFTSGVDGSCGGMVGWPAVDWGDGNTCNGPTGPWEFCFELTVRPYPDCDQDQSTMDLTLGFVTFADGEVGSWTGGPSVCGQDEPLFQTLPSCCTELEFLNDMHDPFCSGGVFTWVLDHPNATFWQWSVESSSNVIGGSSGTGPPGTVVVDNLTNQGTDPELVIYHFLGFDGGACPSVIWDVEVEVFPPITVEMEPFVVCGTPTDPYTITPTIEGGDAGSYSFMWHDGSTNPTFEVDMPVSGQQYCVTVTDAVGCEGTDCVVLDVYTTFPVDITPSALGQCPSDGPISLSAEAMGGSGTFTYNWTGPSGQMLTGPDISVTESGLWLVIAEDTEGCRGRDSVTLNFWESPEIDVFPDNVAVCPDNPVGTQIQALVTGGQNPYSFIWDTPDGAVTTPFIIVDIAGGYGVTVTDANGCTNELQFDVDEQESPEIDLGTFDPVCPEELTLGVQISADLDPDYVHYAWSNGEAGSAINEITVDETGYYYVTITNIYGCKGVGETYIEAYPPAEYNMPDTIAYCQDNFAIVDGETGWVGGAPGSAEYQWEGPGFSSTEQEVFIFNAGLYFVTVTDDNGCTAVDEIEMVEEESIGIDFTGEPVVCSGQPTVITASPGYATYEWSDGVTDESSITVNAGNQWYTVTVSDGDGCFGVDSIFVEESDPQPAIQGESVCEGTAATLDVGTWDQIMWSTGDTGPSITTDTTGTFTVTVTDQLGCTNTATYTVNVASNPVPDIQGPLQICEGEVSLLDAGGPYASYLWSTGETTQQIDVDVSGEVSVIVTSTEGCEGFDTVVVAVSAAPVPAITGDTSICNNVAIQLSAGAGFASYQWTGGGSSSSLMVSAPGFVGVTVTDANGCTGTDMVEVIATAPTPAISGGTEVCEGGSEVLTATAGFASYAWTGGGNAETLTVNSTGTYVVTVTDQYGCTGTATHNFVVHNDPVPVIDGSSTFCAGSDTDLDAGAGYVSYMWAPGGSNSQVLNVNTSGTYTVTVTDQYGCTGTSSIVVTEATELTLNPPDRTICEGDVITLSVGNFETYLWSNGATTPTIDVTDEGIYDVTVTDGGCQGSADIEVFVNQTPFADVLPAASACNDPANGSTIDFSALVTGGDQGGVWADLDGSGATGSFPNLDFSGVAPGVYTFEYTTNSAMDPCSDVSYLVDIAIGISPELDVANALCNDNGQLNLGSLYLPGTPQDGQWQIINAPAGSNPAVINGNQFNASNADPGTYQLQYTISGYPGNCPDSDVLSVTVNGVPDAGTALAAEQACEGASATFTLASLLTGADPGGTWQEISSTPSTGGAFNGGAGTFNTSGQNPGTYTFEYVVAGTSPCPDASAMVEVVVQPLPIADAGQSASLTCDVTSVVLGGAGSSMGPGISYQWTTTNGALVNPNQLNATATKAGTYTLTVINTATGCESSDDVVVDLVGDIPTDAALNVLSPKCVGDPPGSAQVLNVTGGTPPYTYSLNGGTPTVNANWADLPAGDYMVLITDDLGCKYETNFSIDTPTDIDAELVVPTNVVELGDPASVTFNVILGIADSIVWLVNGEPTCIGCTELVFTPTGQSQIQLTLYDENGCEVTLYTTIQVKVTRNVYIPNVFSPNGDSFNDFFTIYASTSVVDRIEDFSVFSRWGELVYERASILPSSEPDGWDGKFKGEDVMPGVYVFYARVIYVDGVEEVFSGSVTLVR